MRVGVVVVRGSEPLYGTLKFGTGGDDSDNTPDMGAPNDPNSADPNAADPNTQVPGQFSP